MMKDNWHGLGDIQALERKAAEAMKNEAATIAHMALKLVADLRYLNGCVQRGRGEDIDTVHPGRNVFEYIKELEKTAQMHAEMQGIAQNALIERDRYKALLHSVLAVAIEEGADERYGVCAEAKEALAETVRG